jgi:hypothetical protein
LHKQLFLLPPNYLFKLSNPSINLLNAPLGRCGLKPCLSS